MIDLVEQRRKFELLEKVLEGMLLWAKNKALRKYFSFNTMETNEVWGPLGEGGTYALEVGCYESLGKWDSGSPGCQNLGIVHLSLRVLEIGL